MDINRVEPALIVNGSSLQPKAQETWNTMKSKAKLTLIEKYAYIREDLWSDESIRDAEKRLLFFYIMMVFLLALSIFSLSEGVLNNQFEHQV